MTSSFYYRVFTAVERNIWADEIERFIEENDLGLSVVGIVDEGDADALDATPVELLLCDEDDSEVATLVYDRLDVSEILADEIAEFQNVVQEMLPECNRSWVADKLAHSVGCYCFTVFDAGFLDENWDRLATLAEWLRNETNGIEQSDGGQITNEQGAVALVTPFEEELEEEEEGDSVDEEFDEYDGEYNDDVDEEDDESGDWDSDSDSDEEDEIDDFDDEEDEEESFSDEFDASDSEEYDEDDSSFEDVPEGEDEDETEDVDDSELEDEDESEDFVAAIRVGDSWVEKQVDSDESLEEFMRGEI